jgi:hypothetical protein
MALSYGTRPLRNMGLRRLPVIEIFEPPWTALSLAQPGISCRYLSAGDVTVVTAPDRKRCAHATAPAASSPLACRPRSLPIPTARSAVPAPRPYRPRAARRQLVPTGCPCCRTGQLCCRSGSRRDGPGPVTTRCLPLPEWCQPRKRRQSNRAISCVVFLGGGVGLIETAAHRGRWRLLASTPALCQTSYKTSLASSLAISLLGRTAAKRSHPGGALSLSHCNCLLAAGQRRSRTLSNAGDARGTATDPTILVTGWKTPSTRSRST